MKSSLNQTSSWAIAVVLSTMVFGATLLMLYKVADRVKHEEGALLEAKREAVNGQINAEPSDSSDTEPGVIRSDDAEAQPESPQASLSAPGKNVSGSRGAAILGKKKFHGAMELIMARSLGVVSIPLS